MLQADTQYKIGQGNLSLEVKSRYDSNAEVCKDTVNHEFFLSSRRSISTELHGWTAKTANIGASI